MNNNVLVFRNKDKISVYKVHMSAENFFMNCHCLDLSESDRLLTINTDSTYIGMKNIRDIGDQEVVDLLLWNRGFKVLVNPEVANV